MATVGVKGLMLWQEQESSLSTREWLIEITEVLADEVDVVLANPDLEWATETFTCQLCIKVGVTVLLLLLIHSTINNCNKQYQQHAAKSTDASHLMQSVMDFWTCGPCNSFLFCFMDNENKKAQLMLANPRYDEKIPHFEVITSSSQVGNPVFIVIKFLIQITSTYNS